MGLGTGLAMMAAGAGRGLVQGQQYNDQLALNRNRQAMQQQQFQQQLGLQQQGQGQLNTYRQQMLQRGETQDKLNEWRTATNIAMTMLRAGNAKGAMAIYNSVASKQGRPLVTRLAPVMRGGKPTNDWKVDFNAKQGYMLKWNKKTGDWDLTDMRKELGITPQQPEHWEYGKDIYGNTVRWRTDTGRVEQVSKNPANATPLFGGLPVGVGTGSLGNMAGTGQPVQPQGQAQPGSKRQAALDYAAGLVQNQGMKPEDAARIANERFGLVPVQPAGNSIVRNPIPKPGPQKATGR